MPGGRRRALGPEEAVDAGLVLRVEAVEGAVEAAVEGLSLFPAPEKALKDEPAGLGSGDPVPEPTDAMLRAPREPAMLFSVLGCGVGST